VSDDMQRDMGAAVEGVSQDWIHGRVKSMLNATQEISSVMSLQEYRCTPRLELCEQIQLVRCLPLTIPDVILID
jgi:hypothetical protein